MVAGDGLRSDFIQTLGRNAEDVTGEFSKRSKYADVISLLSEIRPTLITDQELNQGVLVRTIRTCTYTDTEHRVILSVA